MSTKKLIQVAVGVLVVVMMAGNFIQADEEKVPIEIMLPKPLFIGTPPNIKSRNLATYQKRPAFMAPKDVALISKGKPVTASDMDPVVGELKDITDGNKEGDDGSVVEFGPGVQWVQVDLGAECEIFAILAWHYHSQARVYHDVIVQISNDADFVSGVATLYNNDDDNSAKLGVGNDKEYIENYEGRLFDAKGVTDRYVRLYSNGNTTNDMNHMIEVEVYGRPVAAAKSAEKENSEIRRGKVAPNTTQTPVPAGTPEMVPLDIKYPKPMFVGTPKNIQFRNLEASGPSSRCSSMRGCGGRTCSG